MYIDIDIDAMKAYILNKFTVEGDFDFLEEGELAKMVDDLMDLDNEYMAKRGADEGADYDDDDAYELIFAGMQKRWPKYKEFAMRLSEDYLDFAEEYLESVGAIEWE